MGDGDGCRSSGCGGRCWMADRSRTADADAGRSRMSNAGSVSVTVRTSWSRAADNGRSQSDGSRNWRSTLEGGQVTCGMTGKLVRLAGPGRLLRLVGTGRLLRLVGTGKLLRSTGAVLVEVTKRGLGSTLLSIDIGGSTLLPSAKCN